MLTAMYNSSKKSQRSSLLKKWWFWGIIVIIIATMTGLELTNTTYWFHKRKAVSGVVPSTSPTNTQPITTNKDTNPSSSTDQNTSSSANPSTKDQSAGTPSSSNLALPYGTFVSNHRPNLDGSPAPSTEQSVCQTTPGAVCYIQFTNNSVVKTLTAQKADQNGTTIWNWDVNKSGFTAVSWKITATATLNGTTKTSDDPLLLEVGP